MSANGKQAKGLEDPRDILWVGAVKAQRRQTQAADNKDCVGHIVAENSRQEQRKAGEERLREEQCHQRAEGRYEKGKAHDRAIFLPHAQRDQEQIDVAQVQRQFIENVEAVGIVCTDIRCVHGQRELVAGKQRKIKKANADQKPGAPCPRFPTQQQEYEQRRRCRKQKQKQMQPAKGRYRKSVHFTRRNVFPVFSSRNRLHSSTVPPVRVRLSRGCANRFFIKRIM